MNPQGLEGALSRAVTAAARYLQQVTADQTALLEDAVMNLHRLTGSVEPTGRLQPHTGAPQSVSQLLNSLNEVLRHPQATPSTRSKVIRLLYHLCFHNVSLRRYMGRELEMVGTAFYALKQSRHESLGPQNTIDILRLLQVLTYDSQFDLGMWTDHLLQWLVKQILEVPQAEWMSSCLVVLCNLICRTNSVTKRLQRSSQYKSLVSRLRHLLSNDERIVVVCTLVISGYIDDGLRKIIYDPKNMRDTFLCMFNVLIHGDTNCVFTRHITCDFIKRLVVSEKPGISPVPVFTIYAENLMHYPYFEEKMQHLAELLVTLDRRTEESSKLYDLFHSFCSIPNMVSPFCSAIVEYKATQDRLTTPILAVAETAAMRPEEAIDPLVPIKALRLLRFLCKEVADSGMPLESKISSRQLLPLIGSSLRTTVETASAAATSQCETIVAGLQLTEAVAQDEEMRRLVIGEVTAQLCSHILECQFISNPIVHQMEKPPTQRTDAMPEWSLHGVSIVLQVMRVLAALKDFSKPHKQQYWSALKDEQLIPFVAYAISYGDHNMVHDSLHLYTHCVQLVDFPSKRLGDLVASCVIAKRCRSATVSPIPKRRSPDLDNSGSQSPDLRNLNIVDPNTSKTINDLLERIRSGKTHIKDVRMSEMMTTYERKVNLLEDRNEQLEGLLATSERLRVQAKSDIGRESEADLCRIRELVAENEALRDKMAEQEKEMAVRKKIYEDKISDQMEEIKALRQQKESLEADSARQRELSLEDRRRADGELRKKEQEWTERQNAVLAEMEKAKRATQEQMNSLNTALNSARQENEELASEILQERELVVRSRKHAEEQKIRLEMASKALDEKNRECIALGKRKAEMESEMARTEKEHEVDRLRWKQDYERVEMELESLKSKGQKTQQDLEKMRRLREDMLRLAGGYE